MSLGSLPDGLGALSHDLLNRCWTVTRRPHPHSDRSINAAQIYIVALAIIVSSTGNKHSINTIEVPCLGHLFSHIPQ
jgi:hypothetical protein